MNRTARAFSSITNLHPLRRRQYLAAPRHFHSSTPLRQQQQQQPENPHAAHGNFYKSHGRALFKALTLAFFSYQVFYWAWLAVEAEEMRDEKEYEIRGLEGEVRLLEEGRKGHRVEGVGKDR